MRKICDDGTFWFHDIVVDILPDYRAKCETLENGLSVSKIESIIVKTLDLTSDTEYTQNTNAFFSFTFIFPQLPPLTTDVSIQSHQTKQKLAKYTERYLNRKGNMSKVKKKEKRKWNKKRKPFEMYILPYNRFIIAINTHTKRKKKELEPQTITYVAINKQTNKQNTLATAVHTHPISFHQSLSALDTLKT